MTKYDISTYCSLAFCGFDNRAESVCCWLKVKVWHKSFKEIKDIPIIHQLQQDLINGVKSSLCSDCWYQESIGIKSMRQQFLEHKTDEIIQNEINTKKLKHLVIDSGNVCNLACRTCHPASSSSLIKEFEAKPGHNKKPFIIKKTDVENLNSEDYSQITTISILGGEPFQNLDHLKILENIINQGYADQCSLFYCTNGTIKLPKYIKNILAKFKFVNLTLSIDGTEKPYEYIRTNGKWNTILENVKDLKELSNNHPSILVSGHTTVSALNVLYLEDLFKWYSDNNLFHDIVFCDQPARYSFSIFDQIQKQIIIDHLEKSNFNMSTVIQHVKNSKFSQSALDEFYKEILFTKEFKNLDINDYLPNLINLLNQNNLTINE